MENASVSINVLHYNTFDKTKKCIDSCLKQIGLEYCILLIDNASTDDSVARLKTLYGDKILYLLNDNNYGYAKGNNIGIKYCYEHSIRYSFILNSDTELVGSSLLKDLLTIIKVDDNYAVVGPLIYDVTQKGLCLNTNDSTYLKLLRFFKVIPSNSKISSEVETISEAHGAALLIDNKIFLHVGGFPEHYFMYNEESTFAKRILWNGNSILWLKNSDAFVKHHHDTSGGIDNWRLFLQGRNRAIEYLENRTNVSWKIVYWLFKIKTIFSCIHSGNFYYLKGMRNAERQFAIGISKVDFFVSGKNAIEKINS